MGTFSKSLASCGGFVAGSHEVIDYLRISSRAFLFTASAVPAAVGAALAALRVLRSEDGPPLLARRARERARACATACEALGFAVVAPQQLPADAGVQEHAPGLRVGGLGRRRLTIVTPIVPVLVGDDWKAALLWRALYDAGVFVNTALHPAVPPGGALLRTSVMATHDAADARPRAGGLRARQARVRGRARSAPGPARALTPSSRRRPARRTAYSRPILHKSGPKEKGRF